MSTLSFSFEFFPLQTSYSSIKRYNQNADQRTVHERKVNHFETERRWKINQSYCTHIGPSQYNHLECPEEERNHWCAQQQMSN